MLFSEGVIVKLKDLKPGDLFWHEGEQYRVGPPTGSVAVTYVKGLSGLYVQGTPLTIDADADVHDDFVTSCTRTP